MTDESIADQLLRRKNEEFLGLYGYHQMRLVHE